MIFPGSALRGVNRCGKRQVAALIEATSVVGRGRDWLPEHVWLSVERSWDVPIMLRRAGSNSKEVHLTCSKLIQF